MTATREYNFGSPVLPSQLRKVDAHDDGSITLHVDSEVHDKALLRSVADAIRTNPEVVGSLLEYANVLNALDENERTDGPPQEKAALEDQASDLLDEIDRDMEWASVGEGEVVRVNAHDAETLASALVYAVAAHIETTDSPVIRDLHRNTFANATGRTA